MKPVDFRNATFHSLRDEMEGLRRRVYEAWVAHGPGTTRQMAVASGIDLLTFRPRTTELVQLGLVELVPPTGEQAQEIDPHEGVYRAVPQPEWERFRASRVNGQLQLI
jgi:hypothetical protein